MKLYWHKWVHKRGTVYMLMYRPQVYGVSVRETGEIAIVQRLDGRWHGSWTDAQGRSARFVTGAPGSTQKAIERDLDKRSIGLFGVDVLEFVPSTLDNTTRNA